MSIKTRIAVTAITLSASGLIGIASYEGYTTQAVIPVPGDVPTIGFGTTSGVKMGDKTDPVRALIRLGSDADATQTRLRTCIKVPLYQNEWDAYTQWAYNVGTGAACGSTLVKLLNQGQYTEACNQLPRWNKAGGKVLAGLTARREKERALCLG